MPAAVLLQLGQYTCALCMLPLTAACCAMQVRIVMDNVSTPQDCALLLSAFSIPTKIKAKKGAAAAAAAAAAAEQAAEGSAAPAAQAAAEASV
jgi:hypothetical protein